jgi:DNA-binding NarL/FixJ family response regulator
MLLYSMIPSVDGSDRNLNIKRESRRRRVYVNYLSGKSQAEIARELGLDRGTVRLDLDAMRAKFEVDSEPVLSVLARAQIAPDGEVGELLKQTVERLLS